MIYIRPENCRQKEENNNDYTKKTKPIANIKKIIAIMFGKKINRFICASSNRNSKCIVVIHLL